MKNEVLELLLCKYKGPLEIIMNNYTYKLSLEEIHKFPYNLPRYNLMRPIISNDIESVTKYIPEKKCLRPKSFTSQTPKC
jgi:hypothetical protein